MARDRIDCPLGNNTVSVSVGERKRLMCGASDARRRVCIDPVSAQKEGGMDDEKGWVK